MICSTKVKVTSYIEKWVLIKVNSCVKWCRFLSLVLIVEMESLEHFRSTGTCKFLHSSKYNTDKMHMQYQVGAIHFQRETSDTAFCIIVISAQLWFVLQQLITQASSPFIHAALPTWASVSARNTQRWCQSSAHRWPLLKIIRSPNITCFNCHSL